MGVSYFFYSCFGMYCKYLMLNCITLLFLFLKFGYKFWFIPISALQMVFNSWFYLNLGGSPTFPHGNNFPPKKIVERCGKVVVIRKFLKLIGVCIVLVSRVYVIYLWFRAPFGASFYLCCHEYAIRCSALPLRALLHQLLLRWKKWH